MRIILLAAAALVATPAVAQIGPEPFNGAFVGIQGGWQQDRQTLETQVGNALVKASNKKDGFNYGGQIGYDFRVNPSVVFGLEAAITGRTGETFLDDGFDVYRLTQGRTISTTARVGFMTDPQGLVYARGGYANAKFNLDDAGTRFTENRDGWTVGAGYERAVSQNVSARVEYGYSDFGRDRLGAATDLTYRRHAVNAGLNFRF
ncbi:membrane protein [Polymorphobacter multimanifer]|uniref:Outer membrane immunogenic protein n=1 Tax=Polymorphobacter multimanifer TaxID=1070431 RepID=A0A841L7H3_9SPHN|nr:outer membrane beta-barrel protein [Polymorphobacter multimanifer]MBB6228557.1 outer membrane immunogenic protein [Polymorphobacter multimanifer]GGI75285.1 membrane protein [Polymorphobacter multimanifer]